MMGSTQQKILPLLTAFSCAALTAACGLETEGSEGSEGSEAEVAVASEDAFSESISASQGANGELIPNDNDAVAHVYREGSKRWVRWVSAQPWSTGPVLDQTGDACAQGQSGPVWLLAGTSGTTAFRSCTIPKYKLIFLPLVNHWIAPRPTSVDTPEELTRYRAFVNSWFPANRAETCTLHLIVDGVEVLPTNIADADAVTWTQDLTDFSVDMNVDNYAGAALPGGLFIHVTAGGHYALLQPFAPGSHHTVQLGGTQCDADGTWFSVDVTYDLTISN